MRTALRHAFRFGAAAAAVLLAAAPSVADVERLIEARLHAADISDTRVSVFVYDIDQGETLAQVNADARMIPASNMKLVTTAAALLNLGPDFAFRTELRLLHENHPRRAPALVIRGDGDPAFGDPVILEQHGYSVEDLLDLWVQAVLDTGLKRFETLYVDDRVFDRTFTHETWPEDQLIYRWCAPVAGLNFYQNVLDVLPQPTSWGRAPIVALFPAEAAEFLRTSNKASTGRTDSFWISREAPDMLSFHGSVKNRRRTPVQITLADPPRFLGRVLAQRLESRGVRVDRVERPARDLRLPDGRVLHRMRTTLPLVLERTNQDSQNMFAEALFKRMGRKLTGRPGSFENGAAAVRVAFQQLLGPRVSVLKVVDGSGMSRENRLTARFLVELLVAMERHENPEVARIFRESLAVGGANGTLRKRFHDFDPNARVLAKSGYLRGVSALSGYVLIPQPSGDSRRIAFATLFNGFEPPLTNTAMKRLQEQFVEAIHDDADPGVRLGG